MKCLHRTLLAACILFVCSSAHAQAPCPAGPFNGKLSCMLPSLFGTGGFSASGSFGNSGHNGHFDASIKDAFATPLGSDISRQLSVLPSASPGSGFTLVFDPSLKTFVTSTDSLGPILGERAETIGRHRLAIGVSYQFFQFDKIDGVNLANFPTIFTHANDTVDATNAVTGGASVLCSASLSGTPDQSLVAYSQMNNPSNLASNCAWVRDRVSTTNGINLKVHQVTASVTFGLTRNIDVSVVIPYENIRFGVASSAQLIPGSFNATEHYFSTAASPCSFDQPVGGFDAACFNHQFPDSTLPGSGPRTSSASGIGDVTVRVKGTVLRGERAGLAAGVDVRFPSGDALNYLGSGAYGVRPFAIVSYRARISPHGMIGIEANGSSVTSGDVTTGAKGQVPNQLTYDVGADAYATKWLTGAFDIVGQRVFNAPTVAIIAQQYLPTCDSNNPNNMQPPSYFNGYNGADSQPLSCKVIIDCNTSPSCSTQSNCWTPPPSLSLNHSYCSASTTAPPMPPTTATAMTLTSNGSRSYNITNASVGLRIALVKRLVLTLNGLIRLDSNGGLHSKPAPMIGLGYTF